MATQVGENVLGIAEGAVIFKQIGHMSEPMNYLIMYLPKFLLLKNGD